MKRIFFYIILTLSLALWCWSSNAGEPFNTALALQTVFKNEGGLSMDKNDSGNWSSGKCGVGKLIGTKYGIAGSVYGPYFAKRGKSIKDITIADAALIYDRDYASPLKLSQIKSQRLGTMFLDTAINCGTGTAAILAARTINVLNGKAEDIPVDPILGVTEINWINDYTKTRWYEGEQDRSRRQLFASVFKEMRSRRYVAIVRHDPNKLRYLPTWLERTYE